MDESTSDEIFNGHLAKVPLHLKGVLLELFRSSAAEPERVRWDCALLLAQAQIVYGKRLSDRPSARATMRAADRILHLQP